MSSTQQLLLGEGAGGVAANYIEDVFSTWLYTGNGSIQSIPNGINLGPNTGNSNYFNAGQINTNSSASAFDLGTSDWTVECWIKTSYTSRIDPFELNGGTSSGFFGLTLNSSASGDIEWNESSGGSSVAVVTATGTTVANGSWHNIAVTRSGNSVRLFFDGTQVGSTYTTSYTYGGASKAFRFGNRYPGGISSSSVFYISNFRIVKGTALYTTTFTPSTQPLTQISGTSYLGAQSLSSLEDTTLIGNSYTNNVTPNGSGPFSYGTGSGGLVWMKGRSGATSHSIFDTSRGTNKELSSNTTGAQSTLTNGVTEFNSSGFTIGANSSINTSAATYVSWTFRKQPKFFDVVTYTGTGAVQNIAHNLGSVPGCIIVKTTNATTNWIVQHRSSGGGTQRGLLNSTSAFGANSTMWDNTNPTSSVFTVGTNADTNQSGNTFVAYLFAHDAGGFGLTGTDNVISCGSYTGNGSTDGPVIDLGYEPQWLLIKSSSAASTAWILVDNMRGMTVGGADAYLKPNSSDAETTSLDLLSPTATGFKLTSTLGLVNGANDYIYIAIRRGPMKVPTSGTSVYNGITRTGTTGAVTVTGVGFTPDMGVGFGRSEGIGTAWYDRLRGKELALRSALTNAEYSTAPGGEGTMTTTMDGMIVERTYGILNSTSVPYINWFFKRAPSFFDEVCYTGTGSGTTITHNLGVTPELVITKSRTNGALGWVVWTTNLTNTDYWIRLDSTMAQTNSPVGYGGTFSASNYTIANTGPYNALNGSGQTFVAYLFASCAGVSKVGSFTGNGSSQTINCGFTGGARFVLIKATSTTGDWMVADSARGIVSGSDPYLELNNTNAEVTGEDWLDTDSTGFVVNEVSGSNANTNGVTYIFLAIA